MTEASASPREAILVSVERKPGLHLRELARQVDVSLRTVRYHLERLEAEDAVVRHPAGRFVRWFRKGEFSPESRTLVASLRVESQRRVLGLLLAEGPLRFTDLEERLRVAPSTLARNLRQLVSRDLVRVDADRRYRLHRPEEVRVKLARYRSRFPDLLADAAEELFG